MNRSIMNHVGITKVLIGGTLLGAALSAVAGGPQTLTGSLSYTREEGVLVQRETPVG